jgi:hypothetical protein
MKPIFVCYVQFEEHEQVRYIRQSLEEKLGDDYHILVVSNDQFIGIKFELFNSDLEEKDFEDLKKKLL